MTVARPLQIGDDLIEDMAGARPHHHDAIGECDGFVNVVRDKDHHRPQVGPTDRADGPVDRRG